MLLLINPMIVPNHLLLPENCLVKVKTFLKPGFTGSQLNRGDVDDGDPCISESGPCFHFP